MSLKYRDGFWDYVRDVRGYLAKAFRRDPEAQVRGLEGEALVDSLLDYRVQQAAVRKLREKGPGLVPLLLDALLDPRFRNMAEKPPECNWSDDIPIAAVLAVLRQHALAEVIPRISDLIHSPFEEMRKAIALALGSIAADGGIKPLRVALADPQGDVRSYALMGLREAYQAARGSMQFRRAMFDAVVPLLDAPDMSILADPPGCLLLSDRERAVSLLVSDECLSAERENLHYTLKALNEAEVTIPVDRLRLLLGNLRESAGEYPQSYSYGYALIALAKTGDSHAEPMIREAIAWKKERVSELAGQALCILHRIEDPWRFVLERIEEGDFSGLNKVQQHFYAAFLMKCEVDNGGLAQFFANSAGDHAHEALAGLRAAGATESARILADAMQAFGELGPSPDRKNRGDQLSQLTDRDFEAWDRLNVQFYKDEDSLEARLFEYVATNHLEFRK